MSNMAKRPDNVSRTTRPRHEQLEGLTTEEGMEFFRIVFRSADFDTGTMRIWSEILFHNGGV